MQLEIEPYVGIGPIKFGMTIDEVRNFIKDPPKSFLKGPASTIPTDAFDGLGLHVFYKKPGVCNAVEMFLPASPTFQGQRLIKRSFNESLSWLQNMDDAVKVDQCGATSFKFGIGLYAPEIKEDDSAPIEAVIVFERDYYKK
ncbi:MAG TPA: hypothetical protein VNU95_00295 [Candidatus Acidoferrales bacterium]|jgi:hypothetical protein|nr:hypothetical protein [Candidatus Acidoferrales bacterium]